MVADAKRACFTSVLFAILATVNTASATDEYQACTNVYRHVIAVTVRSEYPDDDSAFHVRETARRINSMHTQRRIKECAQHRLATGYDVNRRATACMLKADTFDDIEKCDRYPVFRK